MTEKEKNSTGIHFGPRTVHSIPLTVVHELQQVRSEYQPESLQELATSMVVEHDLDASTEHITSDAFDLSNPITVAYLSEDEAQQYVRDHAEYYGVEPIDASLLAADDGTVTFLIAGHRRKRALYMLADRFAIDPESITVSASVREHITFAESLGLQLRENVHERPPIHDEARAIERFYRDVARQQGDTPSLKWFATQLGFSVTKVRDALAFASLPVEIQQMTENGQLSYTVARQLKPLEEVYERVYAHEYPQLDEDGLRAYVHDSLVTDAMRLTSDQLRGSETKPRQYIDNQIQALYDRLTAGEALFELIAEVPTKQRARVSGQLSQLAIRTLEWQANTDGLQDKALEELTVLRQRIDAILAAASQPDEDASLFGTDQKIA